MGGKSGLRGRCVQPCRRVYKQGSREGRFFSSMDLSLDVLTKTLLDIAGIRSWKIEGRKKGPHYVYYVTTAYKMLRENDPALRRDAEKLLEMSLSRSTTHARFLPQHNMNITAFGKSGEDGKTSCHTSSGLLCGKIILAEDKQNFILKTRMDLLPKDYLRIGHEDEPWHQTLPVNRKIPKGGSLTLKLPKHKSPKINTPVFLIDRREPELVQILGEWQRKLDKCNPKIKTDQDLVKFMPANPKKNASAKKLDIILRAGIPSGREGKQGIRPGTVQGLWLSPKALGEVSRTLFSRISWWLPPVIWPDEEDHCLRNIRDALRNGARHFVCNSPWQEAFFADKKGLSLTAGPYCNITNIFSLGVLASLGFNQAIVSPELGEADYLALPKESPLPLGIVLSGFWPVGISRHSATPLKQNEIFSSPKHEGFWLRQYGQNNWLYPAWPLNLNEKRAVLEKAGYSTFITLDEHPPKNMEQNSRTSLFNWQLDVL
jgi:putative protease